MSSSTQRSINMAADMFFTDSSVGSVLVSNSITPTSLGSSGGGSVMSALFRGKRKASDGGVGRAGARGRALVVRRLVGQVVLNRAHLLQELC